MKVYNYETIHTQNKMVHIFSDRVRVEFLKDANMIGTFKDGELIDSFSPDENYKHSDYMDFLLKIAQEAERLNRFSLEG